MDVFTVDAAKLAIVAATGLSKDTLHVYVGLARPTVILMLARCTRMLESLGKGNA